MALRLWLSFPKSLSVSKAIDKHLGVESEKIPAGNPVKRMIPGADQNKTGSWIKDNGREYQPCIEIPASEQSKQWDGWGSSLKPSFEPVLMCMAPIDGTFANNALVHGVAGVWIDGARIGYQSETDMNSATPQGSCTARSGRLAGKNQGGGNRSEFERPELKGRWPANTLLQHHPLCECVGNKSVKNKSGSVRGDEPSSQTKHAYGEYKRIGWPKYGDENGTETVEDWKCHPDCPVRLLDEQSGVLKSGGREGVIRTNQWTQDGRLGQPYITQSPRKPDTGGASRFFYCAKASRSERGDFNKHPTVKPIAIMKYLCNLTKTPTGGIVLDPFAGSGTTVLACIETGRPCVAIEKDAEAFETMVRRVENALSKPKQLTMQA